MSVLRLLREPRWVRGLTVAILIALVCCVLGRWQWHRRQERLAANAPLVQNYHADPVEVGRVLPPGAALGDADVWTPVRVSGTYDTAATVLARNRPRDEATGYDVLVPLVLGDGTALLVDRGWVPAGASSERPDAVPAAPPGEVTVTARLRHWEAGKRGTVPAGQVASIARDAVAETVTTPLLDGYAVLASEDPAPASAPAAAVEPDVDEGPHLAYTVQWFGFALTALIVWVVAGRRELDVRRTEAEAEAEAEAFATAPASPAPAEPGTRRRTRRPARSGVDEDAEDAELDAADQHF